MVDGALASMTLPPKSHIFQALIGAIENAIYLKKSILL
jgi:hypothetical protein